MSFSMIHNEELSNIRGKNRIVWADIARTVAILCIVLCHVVESIYPFTLNSITSLSSQARIFALSLMYLGRLGVPIFLVLTGYLLLSRDYSIENSKKFWKNKCLPLFICTELWIFLYWIFQCFLCKNVDFLKLIYELLFLRNTDINHLWYLPMILGIYIFIPFISRAIKYISNKVLWIFVGLVLFYCFIIPLINTFLLFNGLDGIKNIVYLEYSGKVYGVYVIIGYLMSKKSLKISSVVAFLFFITTFFLAVFVQNFFYCNGYEFRYWYDSVFVFLGSFLLILFLNQISGIKKPFIFNYISIHSFSIYLIHNLILTLILMYIPNSVDRVLKCLLVYVFTLVLSLIASIFLSKFKLVKKYFFLMK